MEKINYKGWPNCLRLSNGLVDLVVTTDVGPRIIRFGFIGQDNEFKEFNEQVGGSGGDAWKNYGGHRLWHAPEDPQRTYFPDNSPVDYEPIEGGIHIIQPVESLTGIQKEIDIFLSPTRAHAQIVHRLKNTNLWAIELAPWALSVMAVGGTAIIPLPPRGSHLENLVPSNMLSLWAYTDMSDPRWTWGQRYILLRQDPTQLTPQKLGALVPDGWMAYARQSHLFLKKITYLEGELYPDLGCNMETFTNDQILEVESLGPMTYLEPGDAVEHIEDWFLFQDVAVPVSDEDVIRSILPKVDEAKGIPYG
jgi:hypothetical protein